MIVVDTNVLSELARHAPDARVLHWFESQPDGALYTTAITHAEILFGLALLPRGVKRDLVEAAITRVFTGTYADRILPFDSAAAPEYARICAARRAAGRPISQMDAQIAAITRARRARLATRDVAGFEGLDIEIVNPFGTTA